MKISLYFEIIVKFISATRELLNLTHIQYTVFSKSMRESKTTFKNPPNLLLFNYDMPDTRYTELWLEKHNQGARFLSHSDLSPDSSSNHRGPAPYFTQQILNTCLLKRTNFKEQAIWFGKKIIYIYIYTLYICTHTCICTHTHTQSHAN